MQRRRIPALLAGLVYLLFAGACFRLIGRDDAPGLALGEGLFTLLGAMALLAAAFLPRRAAALVLLGTLPLVGWFLATPYNSGPPFLVASLIAPVVAAAAALAAQRRA